MRGQSCGPLWGHLEAAASVDTGGLNSRLYRCGAFSICSLVMWCPSVDEGQDLGTVQPGRRQPDFSRHIRLRQLDPGLQLLLLLLHLAREAVCQESSASSAAHQTFYGPLIRALPRRHGPRSSRAEGNQAARKRKATEQISETTVEFHYSTKWKVAINQTTKLKSQYSQITISVIGLNKV